MSKHAPGPWEVRPNDYGKATKWNFISVLYVAAGETTVARVTETSHAAASEQEIANARLIASAPELLAALKDAMQDIETLIAGEKCDHDANICWCGYRVNLAACKDIIAKAEGE